MDISRKKIPLASSDEPLKRKAVDAGIEIVTWENQRSHLVKTWPLFRVGWLLISRDRSAGGQWALRDDRLPDRNRRLFHVKKFADAQQADLAIFLLFKAASLAFRVEHRTEDSWWERRMASCTRRYTRKVGSKAIQQ
jgi:hypothetical protein